MKHYTCEEDPDGIMEDHDNMIRKDQQGAWIETCTECGDKKVEGYCSCSFKDVDHD
jgi:hypothetical protein